MWRLGLCAFECLVTRYNHSTHGTKKSCHIRPLLQQIVDLKFTFSTKDLDDPVKKSSIKVFTNRPILINFKQTFERV